MNILNTLSLNSNRKIKIIFNSGDLSSNSSIQVKSYHRHFEKSQTI